MNHRCMQGSMCLFLLLPAIAAAADWPEWRGPLRNGVAEMSPALATNWPAGGPVRLWLSEDDIPGGDIPGSYTGGSFGGVAVADGRVYCQYILPRKVPLTTRTLTEPKLASLGWAAKRPPAAILEPVEQARLSAARLTLATPAEVQAWVTQWVETNLTVQVRKEYGSYITARLRQGKDATDLEVLDKLATIRDKPFANTEALNAWFAENGIEDDARKTVQARIPEFETYRDTAVVCLDAATGKTVWRKIFPGGPMLPIYENAPASCTPCVAAGKVYVLGTRVTAFCLDAATGEKVWSAPVDDGRQRDQHCSFIVADNVAAVPAGPFTGFDAATGAVLWTNGTIRSTWSSPVAWASAGKRFFVVRDGLQVICVEPRTGRVLWNCRDFVPDVLYAGMTPAVAGDLLALGGKNNVRLYRLSAEKAEPVWSVECPTDYCCSPTICSNRVYVFGRSGGTCLDAADGRIVWQDREVRSGCYTTPILADGKAILQGARQGSMVDGSLYLFRVSGDRPALLAEGKDRMAVCTTPALVDGRLYCRLPRRVACYDLRP